MSLNEEIQTLDTYLKLEQLRFGFTYQLLVDDQLNIYEISLPVLLLQPVVENAVKHGAGALQENGKITLSFKKYKDNLVVLITDNGEGLQHNNSSQGFGLKLTSDRIKLLNELNHDQEVSFELGNKQLNGTEAKFIFSNWLI